MKRLLRDAVAVFAAVLLGVMGLRGQNAFEHIVSFDKIVHDFGDILITSGPQECVFTLKNIGKEPVVIHRVLSSCGCTEPTWTKSPLKSGEIGEIRVVFLNDQGPYPFNKTMTVYLSGLSKPVLLKVKGTVHNKEKSLKELFPFSCGPIGVRDNKISAGQIEQGLSRTIEIEVANTSGKSVKVSFADITPGLSVSVPDNKIAANSKERIRCTIDTEKTRTTKWGKTPFRFSIVANGNKCTDAIEIDILIKENFTMLSENDKRAASLPQFESSSIEFGTVKKGERLNGKFIFKNVGKMPFEIYKADASEPGAVIDFDNGVILGEKGEIRVDMDTKGQNGEILNILTIITNSPTRPIINLFLIYTVQ